MAFICFTTYRNGEICLNSFKTNVNIDESDATVERAESQDGMKIVIHKQFINNILLSY